MWTIDIEVRIKTEKTCLLACRDGSRYVIEMPGWRFAEILDNSVAKQDSKLLGKQLSDLFEKHNCFIEKINDSVAIGSGTDNPQVIICGFPQLRNKLTEELLNIGILAKNSVSQAREESYNLFKGGLLVVCFGTESLADRQDQIRGIDDLGIKWLPISSTSTSILIGPYTEYGEGATFDDSILRNRATAADFTMVVAEEQPPIWGSMLDSICSGKDTIRVIGELIAGIVSGKQDTSEKIDTVWEVDRAGNLEVHAVLPCRWVNHEPCSKQQKILHPQTYIVDRKYGIVRDLSVVQYSAQIPDALISVQARTTDLRRVSPYVNTVFCQGADLNIFKSIEQRKLVEKSVTMAALGESVERYCSNLTDLLPIKFGSFKELTSHGVPALDPRTLVLFSEKQYATEGFPFTPLETTTRISWVEGKYLDDESPVFVPACLVYVNWKLGNHRSEPSICFHPFAGVAAGADSAAAIASGLSEIIERHATMVWWLNRHPLQSVILSEGQRSWFGGTKNPLRPVLINLDNTFGVPVAAGIIHDDTDKLVHAGFSARCTLEEAARKAWTEALTLQEGARDLMNPDGAHWGAIRRGLLPGRSYKKWRSDRNYLDDFRQDLRDVDDLLVQQEVFLDPRSVNSVKDMLDLPETRSINDIPNLAGNPYTEYRKAIENRGLRPIVIDITSPDVSSCGFRVIRSIVPGAVGNTPAAFPYLGNKVVQSEAVCMGWRNQPLDEAEISYFPMPHA